MGCFSFICKESGRAVHSDSFNGDAVHLFLLYNGEVIEEMFGNYDSYGRVFDENGKSFEWKMNWHDVCNLIFDDNPGNGIAAVLDRYYKDKHPVTISEDDPNQGWGEDGEYFGEMGEWTRVAAPYHTVYKTVVKNEAWALSHTDKLLYDEVDLLLKELDELKEKIMIMGYLKNEQQNND